MMKGFKSASGSMVAAVIATVVASLCCIAPLILLALGVSGIWISTLTQWALLRPIGIIVAIIFLILAYWKLYITPRQCANTKSCVDPLILRRQRQVFWAIVTVVILLLAFPWYAFIFY